MAPQRTCRVVAVVSVLALVLAASATAQTPWTAPDSDKSRKSPTASGPKVVGSTALVQYIHTLK